MERRDLRSADDLPMALWQRLRAGQVNADASAAPDELLSDQLSMADWQAVRGRELAGAMPAGGAGRPAPAGDLGASDGSDVLLQLIPRGEGTAGPRGYDTIYNDRGGANYPRSWKKPTELTIDQAIAMAPEARRLAGDYAVGRFQFKPNTLEELKRRLRLPGSAIMTQDLQNRMARELLRKRGYDDYVAGRIDAREFQQRLSQEWSSMAESADDFSHYPGPNHSKVPARTKSAAIQAALQAAKQAYEAGAQRGTVRAAPAAPTPTPK